MSLASLPQASVLVRGSPKCIGGTSKMGGFSKKWTKSSLLIVKLQAELALDAKAM